VGACLGLVALAPANQKTIQHATPQGTLHVIPQVDWLVGSCELGLFALCPIYFLRSAESEQSERRFEAESFAGPSPECLFSSNCAGQDIR
jgi:hypothetical protein